MNQEILKLATAQEDYVIGLRRHFHENPELSGQEEQTLARVKYELDAMGIPWQEAPGGGVIGILQGTRAGKTVLLRADVDALPMQEDPENEVGPRTCVSKVPGVMHACGHDAHTAMLLGTARVLKDLQPTLAGTVYLVFERGEEGGGNVLPLLHYMQQNGLKPDACWAIHVYSGMESGKFSMEPGGVMAGSTGFHVTIRGKGGHGSRPDLSNNPIDCFNAIYTALNSVQMKYITPYEPLTMSVGVVQGGTKGNIIPGELSFSGSARLFDREKVGLPFQAAFRRVVEHICAAYECDYTINRLTGPSLPVVNDPDCSAAAQKAVAAALGAAHVEHHEPWMGSESFGLYLKTMAPGVMAFLGIHSDETGWGAHHNSKFDLDEKALKYGVAASVAYALEMTETELDLSGRVFDGPVLDLVGQMGTYQNWYKKLTEQ